MREISGAGNDQSGNTQGLKIGGERRAPTFSFFDGLLCLTLISRVPIPRGHRGARGQTKQTATDLKLCEPM